MSEDLYERWTEVTVTYTPRGKGEETRRFTLHNVNILEAYDTALADGFKVTPWWVLVNPNTVKICGRHHVHPSLMQVCEFVFKSRDDYDQNL